MADTTDRGQAILGAQRFTVGQSVRLSDNNMANEDIPLGTVGTVLDVTIYARGVIYPVDGTLPEPGDLWAYYVDFGDYGHATVRQDEIEEAA